MKKTLIVCPSIYPNKLIIMKNSVSMTTINSDLIVSNIGNVTQAINNIFYNNPDYEYYFITNDDIIFETLNWDDKLCNKNKISWGRDGIQDMNLCCFPMIDGNIVRALGWLQLPSLTKYCGDLVWKFIGRECNCLNYNPSVLIRHKWQESQVDSVIHNKDREEFAKWLMSSYRDVNKVKEILK